MKKLPRYSKHRQSTINKHPILLEMPILLYGRNSKYFQRRIKDAITKQRKKL